MRGLVQAGGGVKGAFELGVLEVLLGAKDCTYDFMSGTSVGALNTAMLCQFDNESLGEAFDYLEAVWDGITGNSSIWKSWFLGRLSGIWKESFYDSSPLDALVRKHFDPQRARDTGRLYQFGCVDYVTGEYFEVTNEDDDETQLKGIVGSSAFPGFFTPVRMGDKLVIDGGARRVTPLKSAIMAGCTEIDVILTGPRTTKAVSGDDNWIGTDISALTILMRTLELLTDELFARDIKMCEMHNAYSAAGASNKEYIKLNIYEPEEPLLEGTFSALEFDPLEIRRMRNLGREVALAS